jgi:hypothetical protein
MTDFTGTKWFAGTFKHEISPAGCGLFVFAGQNL